MITNIKKVVMEGNECAGTGKVILVLEDGTESEAYNGDIELAGTVYDSFSSVINKNKGIPTKVIHKEIICCGDCPFCIPFGNPFKYLCAEKRIFIDDIWHIHKDCPLEDAE